MHFKKKTGPGISAFGSYSSTNFQPILDFFVPNFNSKYEYSENIKAHCVNTVAFNLHQIKQRTFLDTRYILDTQSKRSRL